MARRPERSKTRKRLDHVSEVRNGLHATVATAIHQGGRQHGHDVSDRDDELAMWQATTIDKPDVIWCWRQIFGGFESRVGRSQPEQGSWSRAQLPTRKKIICDALRCASSFSSSSTHPIDSAAHLLWPAPGRGFLSLPQPCRPWMKQRFGGAEREEVFFLKVPLRAAQHCILC